MSEEEYKNMSASEKAKEDWMNAKWRPMMGWMYMIVCICDFVLFPILHAIFVSLLLKHGLQATGIPTQWAPLTLQGAGLFHIAMGAVLGLAAFGRTQEKLAGVNNEATYQPPAPYHPQWGQTVSTTTVTSPVTTPIHPVRPAAPWSARVDTVAKPIATTASGKKIVPVEDEPEL